MAIGIPSKKWWAAVAVMLVVVVVAGVAFTLFANPGYSACIHWKGKWIENAQGTLEPSTGYWQCVHQRGFWIPTD